MSITPRTSIIMPVYNTAETVVGAIESVRQQTDPDWELLIINDCSPDGADAVIRSHLRSLDDPRIRYAVNPENLGLSSTRNRGITMSSGHWVTYLDSDDSFQPDFLERMHAAASQDPQIDVVACGHTLCYPDGTRRHRHRGGTGLSSGPQMMVNLLKDRSTPYVWDKIFRRSAMGDLEFLQVNRVEDAGYSISAFARSRKVAVISDPLVNYTVNPHSITWGSVPPLDQSWLFMDHLKEMTGAHQGTQKQQDALAAAWILTFLNSAQAAMRLNPPEIREHLRACRRAIRWPLLLRCARARQDYAAAGVLLRLCPALYKRLYQWYVKRSYGL